MMINVIHHHLLTNHHQELDTKLHKTTSLTIDLAVESDAFLRKEQLGIIKRRSSNRSCTGSSTNTRKKKIIEK